MPPPLSIGMVWVIRRIFFYSILPDGSGCPYSSSSELYTNCRLLKGGMKPHASHIQQTQTAAASPPFVDPQHTDVE